MADTARFQNALRRIMDVSRSLQEKTLTRQSGASPNSPSSVSSLSIDVSPPPDVSLKLRALGIPERAIKLMVEAFDSKCNHLFTLTNDALRQMVSHSSPSVHPILHSYVQKAYAENVQQMEAEIYRYAAANRDKLFGERNGQPPNPPKPSFNADFVPFLEKYFEFNAYPSAADRALMARKSMMTPRQIEVWFQNHRNRARKEGKCLPRLRPADELPDFHLAGLEERMSEYIKSDPEKSSSDDSDLEDTELRNQVEDLHTKKPTVPSNVLEPLSSAHAFPSAYVVPPIPFSQMTLQECTSVFSGTPLPWPRPPSSPLPTPSKHRPLAKSQINEFCDLFARLTVRDGSRKVVRRRVTPCPTKQSCCSVRAAVCATSIVLCKGRHPSFVAVPTVPSSSIFSSFPITGRCYPSNQTAHAPSFGLSDAVSPPSTSRRRRKSPQLPRRVPGSTPNSHTRPQRMHHPYASPSRASSSSSSCRTPSSSSESLSTPRTPDTFNTPLPSQTSTTKSASYSPWISYFNLPNFGSPSPSPFQSNPSWFPQDLFLHNPFGVSALC